MKKILERKNKATYLDDDKIVKVFNDKPASDVFNEALNLARALEAGINTPEPLAVEKKDGKWQLVTSYVPGKTLEELMEDRPKKVEDYLDEFIDFQIDIHKHRSVSLPRQKDKYTRMISSLTDELDATTRYDLQMRLDGMPNKHDICHGDFVPSNVILGDDGKLYAVDWAHATQGSGNGDAAVTYLQLSLKNKDLANTYIEKYCKKTDTALQVVRNWTSIVAAAELARHKADNRDFLFSWIEIADYQ